ncbi:phage tail protein [Weissella oryzae SG25]|uniref:Phage tail protein n=1 Tax=Weissella oryzae (strain DSM 25784 / JCM 18191 / LMG 30913 / SG25) TaxID=1329250 RepID=A0A069CWZ1_WEIOS|nr:phage major tail protein, TP901-1 family [Weissella oryzae]GAK31999.1 phage tail protein [Weissella oryzae SG25]
MSKYVDNGVEQIKGNPLLGKHVLWFIQSTLDPIGSKAIMPAGQTGGDMTIGGDTIDEQTKSGRIVMPSTNEDSVDLENYYVPGDRTVDVINDSKHNGHQVKTWGVYIDERMAKIEKDDDGIEHQVFPAVFGYGVVDELEIDDSNDMVSVSYTLNILDKFKDGTFPLTNEQLAVLKELYDFERPGEKTGDFGSVEENESETSSPTVKSVNTTGTTAIVEAE